VEGIFRRGLDVLASLATTSRAMDKWMLQLDSTGQKGPETTLEGVLIVLVPKISVASNPTKRIIVVFL
jgi:hypothetical protein